VKCPECQFENPIARIYCEQCGAPLEHDLEDVQEAVDDEIRAEKAKSTARFTRWFLAASIVLCIIGYNFRAAYKDLPENDIVAFATAPTTEINDRVTITTDKFGIRMPRLRRVKPPVVRPDDRMPEQTLQRQAYRRAAVQVEQRNRRDVLEGLLIGDLVIEVPGAEQETPATVHIADIRHLRPTAPGEWEIRAVQLPDPVTVIIANHETLDLKLLTPKGADDEEPEVHEIRLAAVKAIRPVAEAEAP
jgi:hypothetical protein